MTELLFAPYMTPFSIALGLLFGLMTLELVAALLGGTLLGLGGDAEVDLDLEPGIDTDFDVDVDMDMDLDLDLDGDLDLEAGEAMDAGLDTNNAVSGGVAGWLGMGQVPFLIWVGAFLLAFGLGGFVVQNTLVSLVGFAIPPGIAALTLAPVGFGFARRFSGVFARLLPKTETTALSENHLGRTRGVVTVGTASRGRPAQVRVTDRHGNTHYLRAEPMKDDVTIAQGTEVLVLRKGRTDTYRMVAVSD